MLKFKSSSLVREGNKINFLKGHIPEEDSLQVREFSFDIRILMDGVYFYKITSESDSNDVGNLIIAR
jgi:hypothetical protein